LELCGAVLLSKLMTTVQESLRWQYRVVRCWTDSTIVLGWLTTQKKLGIFEANRVRKITSIIPSNKWHHVDGTDNPADPASRGISVSALLNHPLWFHGPSWLATSNSPRDSISLVSQTKDPSTVLEFIEKCSSFLKMKRVIAFCCRFHQNCKLAKDERLYGILNTNEINHAMQRIIILVQSMEFPDVLKRCKSYEGIKSNIKHLAPLIDSGGILRVGGRLQQSNLPHNQKHPILLPKQHNLCEVIARYYHYLHLHAGPQLLLAIVREQFWVIRGIDVMKRCVRKCIVCHRHSQSSQSQLMGSLPASRVSQSHPFSKTGVDYAGPFSLCLRTGRNPIVVKAYVALFICMSVRAIHLEWVSDQSTPAFVAALTRFISRRGQPSDIYCDGGKNFVGANNEIKEFLNHVQSKDHVDSVSTFLANKGINFHFNPPYSPHHGGLWEAGVKSMKYHLKRVIEDRKLSIEEFVTLLSQVEASLNSRPLTPLSSDPNDYGILTPGHFLTGDSLTSLPQPDLTQLKPHHLDRWQYVQRIFQHFWRRWNVEYLRTLQSRPKWYTTQPNMDIGVLVLIQDDDPNWGPLRWKLGRIIKTYPGHDGLIRVCDVKTPSGSVYKRPITKLSPLPIYQ